MSKLYMSGTAQIEWLIWSEVEWRSEVEWSEVRWVKWRSQVKGSEVKWREVRWGEGKWGEVKGSEVKWREVRWSEGKWSTSKRKGFRSGAVSSGKWRRVAELTRYRSDPETSATSAYWPDAIPQNFACTVQWTSCNCNLTLHKNTNTFLQIFPPVLQPHNWSAVIGFLLISCNFRFPAACSRTSHNNSRTLLLFSYFLSSPALSVSAQWITSLLQPFRTYQIKPRYHNHSVSDTRNLRWPQRAAVTLAEHVPFL
jgi:hypothetical protein